MFGSVWLPFHRLLLWEIPLLWKFLGPFSQAVTLGNTSALEVFGSLFTGCYSEKYLYSGSVWLPFHRSLLLETSLLWKCLAPISQVAILENTSALEVLAPFSQVATLENHSALEVFGSLSSHRSLLWEITLL